MLSILALTFPFFALVLGGFIATWRGLLPVQAIPGLNAYVLYFALPCMLYRLGASTPVSQLLDFSAMAIYALGASLLVAITVALTVRRQGWNNAAFGALVTAFPNTGFIGVPLMVAFIGPTSASTMMATLMVDMVFTTSLCIALSRLDGAAGAASAWSAGQRAASGMLTNPMAWSIVLGTVASAWAWHLPGPVERVMEMLAQSASSVALFTIGAVLARAQNHVSERVPVSDYVPLALFKLLLHPLLMYGLGYIAIALGIPLSKEVWWILVLAAALPSASNVSLLTERYGAHGGRVARVILVSTALAFLSFSGVALLSPWGGR